MTGDPVSLIGSGRTDAGVHARAQVANFRTTASIPISGFLRGLNSLLPPDISVIRMEEVPLQFHARRDALEKEYRYTIAVAPVRLPLLAPTAWVLDRPLDLDAMSLAAAELVGTHDFAGFMASGSRVASTVRTVTRCRLVELESPMPEAGQLLELRVAANGFLRYMVRNMVGLLVEIGLGRRPPEAVEEVLASRQRSMAGPTAPPQGLCLWEVRYPKAPFNRSDEE